MSRARDHIRELEEILRALELRGLNIDMFLYAMTDLARHGDLDDLFELCGRTVNRSRESEPLRRSC